MTPTRPIVKDPPGHGNFIFLLNLKAMRYQISAAPFLSLCISQGGDEALKFSLRAGATLGRVNCQHRSVSLFLVNNVKMNWKVKIPLNILQ